MDAEMVQRALMRCIYLWGSPASCNFYPFSEAAALFAFNIHDICITSASATDTILLDRIRVCPVLVFFNALLFILGGLF